MWPRRFPDYFDVFANIADMNEIIPVIAIDGPTASGKGTVAQAVAQRLGYHYLDSGALYRLSGRSSQQNARATKAPFSALAGAGRPL